MTKKSIRLGIVFGLLYIIVIALTALYLISSWRMSRSIENYSMVILVIYSATVPVFVATVFGKIEASLLGLTAFLVFVIAINSTIGDGNVTGGASMVQLPVMFYGLLFSGIGVIVGLLVFGKRDSEK